MLSRCFHGLRGGEMDEAVLKIDRRAAKYAIALGVSPSRGGADFVEGRQPLRHAA
jgi:hypothetical protein